MPSSPIMSTSYKFKIYMQSLTMEVADSEYDKNSFNIMRASMTGIKPTRFPRPGNAHQAQNRQPN